MILLRSCWFPRNFFSRVALSNLFRSRLIAPTILSEKKAPGVFPGGSGTYGKAASVAVRRDLPQKRGLETLVPTKNQNLNFSTVSNKSVLDDGGTFASGNKRMASARPTPATSKVRPPRC
jgi:hypothetical protein